MPARTASPTSQRDKKDHADIVRRMKRGAEKRKQEAEQTAKGREEELQKEKEWEDSLVTTVEYGFNGVIALIAASLPASEKNPDYLTAGVVIVMNIIMNLLFRSTTLDRVILYVTNLLLPASGITIHRMNELPGQMQPAMWLLFFSSNILLGVLGWWYYIRKCKLADYEYRQNVLAFGILGINVAGLVGCGAIS
ncbi:hypothetical protein DIPPA_30994, partial [Diplonema papillatum]